MDSSGSRIGGAMDPTATGAPSASGAVRSLAAELAAITSRPWTLMEVCGGQTHAILRWGLDQLLPPGLRLIHGPGCPVCVTPAATLDAAVALAHRPEVILASYGDMLRVPGGSGVSLLQARASGADVRLVTGALQALELALAQPRRQVVLLAVGFETTAPATALLARQALDLGLANLSILSAHVRVAPAMAALLQPPAAAPAADAPGLSAGHGAATPVQGFLAAGHVGAVIGTAELASLVRRHQLPVVVTGFEPEDLLRGVLACVRQLEAGEPRLVNAYTRMVRPEGNRAARALLGEVFEVVDRPWRGLGLIAGGGLDLRGPFTALDARRRFGLTDGAPHEQESCPNCASPGRPASAAAAALMATGASGPAAASAAADSAATGDTSAGAEVCIAGQVLRGLALPSHCGAFGGACTPEHPLGAPMVSSEGACAAYHRYRGRSLRP